MAITKSQFVMQLKRAGKTASHFYDGVDKEDADQTHSAAKDLYMPSGDFAEFGKPDVITVTIESGDKLNKTKSKTKGRK